VRQMAWVDMNLYDIEWTRPGDEGEVFVCHGLSAIKLVRRLAAAAINFGSVTILAIRRSE